MRPLPLPSGSDDEVQKVRFGDGRSMRLNRRGRSVAEVDRGCRAAGDLAAQRGHRLGAIRGAGDPDHAALCSAIVPGGLIGIDLLYGDRDAGQRSISRFVLEHPAGAQEWPTWVVRHWSIDGPHIGSAGALPGPITRRSPKSQKPLRKRT